MNSQKDNICTIISYHYVRELKASKFPEIKGLETSAFIKQLDYFQEFYKFLTVEDCIDAIYSNKTIPPNSILLTFDDGYIDHYENVFPILKERGIQGSFFPPGKTVLESKVLDVNKIHFLLASVTQIDKLVNDIFLLLDKYRLECSLKTNDYYFQRLALKNRYDSKEVMFVKKLLQKELSLELRSKIINELFHKYVSKDEKGFAKGLYVNKRQLKVMKQSGMIIGSHSYNHFWLNTLKRKDQLKEINLSLDFLNELGVASEDWVMCYPYGAYDSSLIEILKEKKCKLAFTTQYDIAKLNEQNCFNIKRLDTNDFPQEDFSEKNSWTKKVVSLN